MLNEFLSYLQARGKSHGTITAYYRDVSLYLKWCQETFGGKPALLYRANVLDRQSSDARPVDIAALQRLSVPV